MICKLVQLRPRDLSDTRGILRRNAVAVELFDSALASLVQDLKDTIRFHAIAVGLAAPQINRTEQVAAIQLEETDEPTIIVNPRDVVFSGKKDVKREACMSLPSLQGEVERREKISFFCEDENGVTQRIQAKGFLARVYAHEIDHLNGHLYADYLRPGSVLEPAAFFSASDIQLGES